MSESYSFVMNIASVEGGSYTLAPGHLLRHATSEEVEVIKATLGRINAPIVPFAGLPATQPFVGLLWEQKLPRVSGPVAILPESEWRYFVIGFEGTNATVENIQTASDLAPLDLEIGFTILREGGVAWHPGRLFHVIQAGRYDEDFFRNAMKSDLDELASVHALFQRDDIELKEVKEIAGQVRQLKGFPKDSPLLFLGYFAVLESLLTHPPKPSGPYDSITRQVKKKITLLNNRWPRRIDYTPFSGCDPETIWAKMYAYRSRLAHGGGAQFSGELATLGNHARALRLIKETVKAVIRQALTEPRLLLDLRDC